MTPYRASKIKDRLEKKIEKTKSKLDKLQTEYILIKLNILNSGYE